MDVSRRQLVALGAAGAAGAIAGKVATSPPAIADARLGGIHIWAPAKVVTPEPFKGFPHTFVATVYGPDDNLSGSGWGATLEGNPFEHLAGIQYFPCFFTMSGAVQGDVVKLSGFMIFTHDPEDKGMPLSIEGNLATGEIHIVDPNAGMGTEIKLEAKGIVARI